MDMVNIYIIQSVAWRECVMKCKDGAMEIHKSRMNHIGDNVSNDS